MSREMAYDMAVSYLSYCGNNLSMESFKTWCEGEDLSEEDRKRIFLLAVALVMDGEV